jgi:uroporphyrinogen-III decarboxylase
LISGINVDVLSVDYKVPLVKVSGTVGSQIAFAGNMNSFGVMQNASPEEVAEIMRAIRNDVAQCHQFEWISHIFYSSISMLKKADWSEYKVDQSA